MKLRTIPGSTALIYLVAGSAWILGSGIVSSLFPTGSYTVVWFEVAKGLGFILVTSALLYYLLKRGIRAYEASEERFQRAIEQVPVPVMILADDGEIIALSREWTRLSGYARNELPDLPAWRKLAYGLDENDETATGDIRTSSAPIAEGALPVRTRSGEVRMWDFTSIQIGTLRDGRRMIMRAASDVTSRHSVEQHLKAERDRFEGILEASHTGFLLVDHDRVITFMNSKFASMLDVSRSETVGTRLSLDAWTVRDSEGETVKIDDLPVSHVLSTGEAVEFGQFEITGANQPRLVVTMNAAPIFSDGRVSECVLAVQDVTALNDSERQLERARRMESLGNLAGGIAHDFNNLITVILGNVELAQLTDKVDSALQPYVKSIGEAARKAGDLAGQLLAFSRRAELRLSVVDLTTAVHGVVRMLRPLIGEHIELHQDFPPGLPPIRADRSRLEQVLVNLAVNARDAMKGGGTIDISAEFREIEQPPGTTDGPQMGSYVVLTVTDSGAGMDEDTLLHIFEPFFSTKGEEGTGLGLATVYGIMQQHSGHVECESEVGKGTSFHLYFPVANSTEPVDIKEEIGTTRKRKHGAILAVEDDESILHLVANMLREQGYTVMTASRVEEAATICSEVEQGFDLLFTDVILPDGNGLELFQRVSRSNKRLKVIYTTGYTKSLQEVGLNEATETVIRKPYRLIDVLKLIDQVLES